MIFFLIQYFLFAAQNAIIITLIPCYIRFWYDILKILSTRWKKCDYRNKPVTNSCPLFNYYVVVGTVTDASQEGIPIIQPYL